MWSKYRKNYPGFNGQTLISGNPIEIDPLNYECGGNNTSFIKTVSYKDIILFPNPAGRFFNIKNIPDKETNISLIIKNTLGETVLKGKINSGTSIDISDLKKGIYFIKISNNSISVNRKLIKN